MEKFSWSIAATKLLISHYEANEVLYNVNHKDYKKRNKRLALYQAMADAVCEMYVGCTAADVRKKMNSLRCQYVAEKAKILKSMKSGADVESIYKPTAYWFPMLQFLDVSLTPDDTLLNVKIPHSTMEDGQEQNNFEEIPSLEDIDELPQAYPASAGKKERYMQLHKEMTPAPTISRIKHSKKSKSDCYDSLLIQASSTMKEMSTHAAHKRGNPKKLDECEAFGNFVVSELQAIKESSNYYFFRKTKRKIQNVLMETWDIIDAQMTRSMYTVPNTPTSSSSLWTVTSEQSEVMAGLQGSGEEDTRSSSSADGLHQQTLQKANVLDY